MRIFAAVMMYFCTLNLLVQLAHPSFHTMSNDMRMLVGLAEIVIPIVVAIIVYIKSPSF